MRFHPFFCIVAIVGILYAPGLFGGKMFFDFDTITEGYAYGAHFSQHPGDWRGAQYTNGYHSGVNLGVNPDFNLYGFLFTLKPTGLSDIVFFNGIVFLLFLAFAGCTYLFFADRGFGRWMSVGLTAVVIFSARSLLTVFPLLYVGTYLIFPLVCVLFLRLHRRFSWWTVLLGGLTMTYAILFGYVALLILYALPLGAYTLFLFFDARRFDVARARRFLFGVVLMAIMGLSLSAWYWFPLYQLAQDTPRGLGLSFAESQEETIRLFDIPRLLFPTWSLLASTEGAIFIGVPALMLLLISLMHKAEDREERFWCWVLLMALVFAVHFSPLAWLANKLPLLKTLRGPSRVLFFGIIAAGYLVGCGARRFLHLSSAVRSSSFWLRWIRRSLVFFAAILVLFTVFDLFGGFAFVRQHAIILFDARYYAHTSGLPKEHYHQVIQQMIEEVRQNLSMRSPMALFVFASLVTTYVIFFKERWRREKVMAGALLVLGAVYAGLVVLPKETVDASILQTTPAVVTFIKTTPDNAHYRVFSFFPASSKFRLLDTPLAGRASFEDQVTFARDTVFTNTHLRYDLQTIDGYDNFMTRRTSDLLNEVYSESMPSGHRIAFEKKSLEDKIVDFGQRSNILGMMNVKFILSMYTLSHPHLKLVWQGQTTSQNIPIYLYENDLVLPRFFLANQIIAIPQDERLALQEVLKADRDFRTQTIVECPDGTTACVDGLQDGIGGSIVQRSYAPGRVVLDTDTTSTKLLVFNENHLRGWVARIDGKPVSIFFANDLYQGIILPAGKHEVMFEYDLKVSSPSSL